jgi:hypothetical protein
MWNRGRPCCTAVLLAFHLWLVGLICVHCQDACVEGLRVHRCSRPDDATPSISSCYQNCIPIVLALSLRKSCRKRKISVTCFKRRGHWVPGVSSICGRVLPSLQDSQVSLGGKPARKQVRLPKKLRGCTGRTNF